MARAPTGSAVYDARERQLNNGADIGSSAAVFIDGEPVVDIWGGYIDEARTRPWERDTIARYFLYSAAEPTRRWVVVMSALRLRTAIVFGDRVRVRWVPPVLSLLGILAEARVLIVTGAGMSALSLNLAIFAILAAWR
jgi:hypothetical protein